MTFFIVELSLALRRMEFRLLDARCWTRFVRAECFLDQTKTSQGQWSHQTMIKSHLLSFGQPPAWPFDYFVVVFLAAARLELRPSG